MPCFVTGRAQAALGGVGEVGDEREDFFGEFYRIDWDRLEGGAMHGHCQHHLRWQLEVWVIGSDHRPARRRKRHPTRVTLPLDTADFVDGATGNLRVNYVLPSRWLQVVEAGVFWPESSDPLSRLTGTFDCAQFQRDGLGYPTSGHRLVGRRDR